jgi:MraZ protein
VDRIAFSGEFQHGIDEKGRLVIPVKYRDSLGGKYMLSKGFEGCLFAYPMDEWAKLEKKLDSLIVFDRRYRDFKRRFFSGSDTCEIDRQGRTLITLEFRRHAKLDKEVYIVGAGERLEIWDKETWEDYRRGLDGAFESLANEIYREQPAV